MRHLVKDKKDMRLHTTYTHTHTNTRKYFAKKTNENSVICSNMDGTGGHCIK
jgi:hypothetical protein